MKGRKGEINGPSMLVCCVAECVGTFFVAFTAASCAHPESSAFAPIAIGATMAFAVYALLPVSGAFFNPCLTMAAWLSGRHKIDIIDALLYVMAQLFGAVVATILCWSAWSRSEWESRTPTLQHSHHPSARWILVEALYVAALCYVHLSVSTSESHIRGNSPNSFSGLAVGCTIAAALIALGPLSTCSLNPALLLGAAAAELLKESSAGSGLTLIRFLLGPAAGVCTGSAAFFVTRGGLAGRYQYDGIQSVSVAAKLRRADCIRMLRQRPVKLPAEILSHDLVCTLKWRASEDKRRSGTLVLADMDLACVKFGASGECLGAAYFGSNDHSGLMHSGDGCCIEDSAHESVALKIAALSPNVQTLIFVGIMFMEGGSFDDLSEYSMSLVDATDDNKEFCNYKQADTQSGKNACVAAMLYRDESGWYFKALNDYYTLPPFSSYRHLMPEMEQLVLEQTV